jgi:hypothetical protein
MEHSLYSIALPYLPAVDLSATRRWLAAAWQGLPRSLFRRVLGDQRHVSLELVGTGEGIRYLVAVPSRVVLQSLADQLSAHFPGAVLESASNYLLDDCVSATVELGSAQTYDQPLLIPKSSEVDPLAGLLASRQRIEPGRLAAVQLLLRPSTVSGLESPAFEVVLRLMAQDASEIGARLQLMRMLNAFGPFAAANRLRPLGRISRGRGGVQRFVRRSWPLIRWHIPILSLEEIATLYHFPDHHQARGLGINVDPSPRLGLAESPPSEGPAIGRSVFRGGSIPVRVRLQDLLRHTMVLAATGGGKSTLLANLAVDLAGQGAGFTLMDPHGELVRTLVDTLPEERLSDVALLRFADPDYPVGLNVLRVRTEDSFLVAEELVEVLRRVYAQGYWGPLLETVLRHAALAVAETGGTLVDMARLLDDDVFREWLISRVRNAETIRFWEAFGQLGVGSQERRAASTANRLQRFLASPLMRNVVGQADSRFDPATAMDRGQIILIDLSGIGVSNAKLLGSMLTVLYYQAALAREGVHPDRRRPHLLMMDECSWFISPTVAEMADQVRKYGLGLVLAAQRLSQIKPDEVRDAIFANFANLICFNLGEQGEAAYVARHFNSPGVGPEEIRRLPPFHAYAQLLLDGRRSDAFSLEGLGPPTGAEDTATRWNRLLAASRQLYARPRDMVEQDLSEQERRWQNVLPYPEVRVLEGESYPLIADAAHSSR